MARSFENWSVLNILNSPPSLIPSLLFSSLFSLPLLPSPHRSRSHHQGNDGILTNRVRMSSIEPIRIDSDDEVIVRIGVEEDELLPEEQFFEPPQHHTTTHTSTTPNREGSILSPSYPRAPHAAGDNISSIIDTPLEPIPADSNQPSNHTSAQTPMPMPTVEIQLQPPIDVALDLEQFLEACLRCNKPMAKDLYIAKCGHVYHGKW